MNVWHFKKELINYGNFYGVKGEGDITYTYTGTLKVKGERISGTATSADD